MEPSVAGAMSDQQYQWDAIADAQGHRRVFVETGTALGETAAWAARRFEKVITIEYAYDLYRAALERFWAHNNVTVMHGDSADLIQLVMHYLRYDTVFWLDAHYDGGEIELAPSGVTPVDEELTTLFRFTGDHVILIDDARLFGRSNYPTLKWVRDMARDAKSGGYDMSVIGDVIRLERNSNYVYEPV